MPDRRRDVRRLAPRLGTRRRAAGALAPAVGTHERSRPNRAGTYAVHALARRAGRARGRRHHRVVGRRGRVPRDAERVEHHPHRGGLGCGNRCHRHPSDPRGAGSTGARATLGCIPGRRRGRATPRHHRRVRGRRRLCRRHRIHGGGRRRAARAGCRRARGLGRRARYWRDARRLGRARHLAARVGAAAARPRARPGHHAAPSWSGLGGAVGQGRLPRSVPRWRRSGSAESRATSSDCSPTAVRSRGRSARWWSTAPSSAR